MEQQVLWSLKKDVVQPKKHPNTILPLQTIFEINSTCKTQAGEVMRAKRSRDAQLVDKFNKQRDDMAAESLASRTVRPTAVQDDAHCSDREDDDLKVPLGVTVWLVWCCHGHLTSANLQSLFLVRL